MTRAVRVAAALAVWIWIGQAAAQTAIRCTLREVEGRKGPPAVDPRLDDVKALLGGPVFREYPAYTLVAAHALTLQSGTPAKGTLSSQHSFSLTFLGRMAARDGKARLRFQLEIEGADKKPELRTIFVINEGGPPFSRVEQKPDRILLQLVSCDPS